MMMTIGTDPGWPTTMPLTDRHSQVVTSDDSYLSQDRPDLKFASMRVMLCGKTIDAEHGNASREWQVPRRQAKSEVLVPLATEWRPGGLLGC